MKTKYIYSLVIFSVLVVGTIFYSNAPVEYNSKKDIANLTTLEYVGSVIVPERNDVESFRKEISSFPPSAQRSSDVQGTARKITQEALKAFSHDQVSLPLLSFNAKDSQGLSADDMLDRIEQGEHILVTWKLNNYYDGVMDISSYEASIKKAKSLKLPLVFIIPAPESALLNDDYFRGKNIDVNPAVLSSSSELLDELSPFANEESWSEVGALWGQSDAIKQIQEWYPNPPLVVFSSQDETRKLNWNTVENDQRYVELYGNKNFNANEKRTFIDVNWIEKYRLMHEGFRDALRTTKWKLNSKFISNNQLSQNMGITYDWDKDATYTNLYANIWPLTADGLSVNFDLSDDKEIVALNSPYATVNNLAFMLDEAKRINTDIAININLDENSKISEVENYRGFAQFGLWFIRPDIITKVGNENKSSANEAFFNELADSIELIHSSPDLKEFWLSGKLVSNGVSPFNENIPENIKDASRWFLLDVDVNSNLRAKDTSEVDVWAFALEKGEGEDKKVLVFAQSPYEDADNISVNVPGYKSVEVKASKNGTFSTFNTPTKLLNNTSPIKEKVYNSSLSLPETSTIKVISAQLSSSMSFQSSSSKISSVVSQSSSSKISSVLSLSSSSKISSVVSLSSSSQISTTSSSSSYSSSSSAKKLNTYSVKSLIELKNILSIVGPSDIIELEDGTYSDSIKITVNSYENSPIIIKAKNKGKVIFTDEVFIESSWVTISGIKFTGNNGWINISTQSIGIRITECLFDNSLANNWILSGSSAETGAKQIEVDHCSFINKKNNINGAGDRVVLKFWLKHIGESYYIHNNYFGNIPRGNYDNGFEVIQFIYYFNNNFIQAALPGDSNIAIENNFFNNAAGESEIISIKTNKVKILNNYFKNCDGNSIVLRKGFGSSIKGNIFDNNLGGVLVNDIYHTIENNYFLNQKKSAIGFYADITGYKLTKQIKVLNNFFYNNRYAININHTGATGIIFDAIYYSRFENNQIIVGKNGWKAFNYLQDFPIGTDFINNSVDGITGVSNVVGIDNGNIKYPDITSKTNDIQSSAGINW